MDECLGSQGVMIFALGFVAGLVVASLLAYVLWRSKILDHKVIKDRSLEAGTQLRDVFTFAPTLSAAAQWVQSNTVSLTVSGNDSGSASFYVHNFLSQQELDALEKGMITDYAEGDGTGGSQQHDTNRRTSVRPLPVGVSDVLSQTLENISWDFDTVSFASLPEVAGKPVMVMGHHLLERFEVLNHIPEWMLRDNLGTDPSNELQRRVFNFLGSLDSRYLANAYHNATHACDVMKSVNILFETRFLQGLLDVRNWTRLICLLAAAVHDMGHTGQTNNYHIRNMSELAIKYNDHSPLEQMHVAMAFQLMMDKPNSDWFGAFREQHYIEAKGKTMPIKSRFRRVIISVILATDMSKHHEHLKKLQDWITTDTCSEDVKTTSDWQMFTLETVLHAADLSNPTYPLPLAWKWATCVLEEFWQQGDLEKQEHGKASMPMFDRDHLDIADSQAGFIKFVVAGFWNSLICLMPEMSPQVQTLQENREFWEERQAKGIKAIPTPQELELRLDVDV